MTTNRTRSVGVTTVILQEKGRDLTQSYYKSPYTNRNVERAVTTQTTPQKSSIAQRLRTDLGRLVGVTTVTQLAELNKSYYRDILQTAIPSGDVIKKSSTHRRAHYIVPTALLVRLQCFRKFSIDCWKIKHKANCPLVDHLVKLLPF